MIQEVSAVFCERNSNTKCSLTSFYAAWGGGCGKNWPTEVVGIALLNGFLEEMIKFSLSPVTHIKVSLSNILHILAKKDTKGGFLRKNV
jgi:hypothetical protein